MVLVTILLVVRGIVVVVDRGRELVCPCEVEPVGRIAPHLQDAVVNRAVVAVALCRVRGYAG